MCDKVAGLELCQWTSGEAVGVLWAFLRGDLVRKKEVVMAGIVTSRPSQGNLLNTQVKFLVMGVQGAEAK